VLSNCELFQHIFRIQQWRACNFPSTDACDWKIQNGQKLPFTSTFYDKNLSAKYAGIFKKVSIKRITKSSEGDKLWKSPLSEAQAALLASQIASSLGIYTLVLEGDTINILLAIQQPAVFKDWNFASIISDIIVNLLSLNS